MLLTASLRREHWFSGLPLHVDVTVTNDSRRHVRCVELVIEQTVTQFANPLTEHLERVEKRIVAKKSVRIRCSRTHRSEKLLLNSLGLRAGFERTWMMDVPKGLATVDTGPFVIRSNHTNRISLYNQHYFLTAGLPHL